MTDVKFMDLSQNDNPATTDSVLIGNSTDGLKRTTVGAIGNLFAVKGLFHLETITAHTDPTMPHPSNMAAGISAPNVPGYNFAFWLNSSTVNTILPNYVAGNNLQKAQVWVNSGDATTPIEINATAVYVKSDRPNTGNQSEL